MHMFLFSSLNYFRFVCLFIVIFRPELIKWEDKMMAAGKPHLVRKSRFLAKSTDAKKPRKKSSSNE